MANENLKNLLALSKQADKIAKTNITETAQTRKANTSYVTKANYDEKIAELDEQVFGKYKKPEGTYSAEEEMERIKNRTNEHITVSNPILQEVLKNPYDIDADVVMNSDPRRRQLDEKLSQKYGNGLADAKKIFETLEIKDKEKAAAKQSQNESVATSNTNVNIDYSLIKTIVEKALDERLNKLSLNENKQHNSASKTGIIMLGENFTFVDNEGNMYKCGDMKYIGKMKIKTK